MSFCQHCLGTPGGGFGRHVVRPQVLASLRQMICVFVPTMSHKRDIASVSVGEKMLLHCEHLPRPQMELGKEEANV